MLPAQVTTTTAPDALSLAFGAGTSIKDVGIACVAVLVPLAVAFILATKALQWASFQMGFSDVSSDRYRDAHYLKNRQKGYSEYYDGEQGDYVGEKDGRYYRRAAGSNRKKYDR